MKKSLKLLAFFSIVLLLSGCGVEPQNIVLGEVHEGDAQGSAEAETSLQNTMFDVGPFYETICYHSMLDVSDCVKMTGKELEKAYYEDVMAGSAEVENVIHMSSAASNTGLDLENRYIMTGKEVDVRDRPRQSGYVLRTLSYEVVDVGAATYSDEGIWCLVSFFCFDSASDNMGWVKLTDLMEYTEENYQLLRYPVKVREGCVDLETGEPVEWSAFAVDYVDDYAHVFREGGRSYNVLPSDIIYPEFYNNSPYNFPTFSDN